MRWERFLQEGNGRGDALSGVCVCVSVREKERQRFEQVFLIWVYFLYQEEQCVQVTGWFQRMRVVKVLRRCLKMFLILRQRLTSHRARYQAGMHACCPSLQPSLPPSLPPCLPPLLLCMSACLTQCVECGNVFLFFPDSSGLLLNRRGLTSVPLRAWCRVCSFLSAAEKHHRDDETAQRLSLCCWRSLAAGACCCAATALMKQPAKVAFSSDPYISSQGDPSLELRALTVCV